MMTVVEANLVPIIVALLIGIAIGWWMFRGRNRAPSERIDLTQRSDPAPLRPRPRDGHEGNSIADQGAAAAADVVGQVIAAPVHPELGQAEGAPDNLQQLKGVGPKLAATLNAQGIARFDQLARLGREEAAMLDENLGAFRGRLARDRVIEQAGYLARGDSQGFEALFGKLGG